MVFVVFNDLELISLVIHKRCQNNVDDDATNHILFGDFIFSYTL